MKRILPCWAAAAAIAPAAIAAAALGSTARADETIPISVALRVGATKRLQTVSSHHSDCSSDAGFTIEVTSPPALGRISRRAGVPARIRHSLSGTCLGVTVAGMAVDYTATQPGTDRFAFDGVFRNGRAHYIVTAHNR